MRERSEAALARHEERLQQHQKLGAIAFARRKQDSTERKATHDAVVRSCMAEGTIRWLLRPAVPSIEPGVDVTQDDYWKLVVQQSAAGAVGGGVGAGGGGTLGGGWVESSPTHGAGMGLVPDGSAIHPQTWK